MGPNETALLWTILQVNSGDRFYGQDANYNGIAFSYVNNGDGTVMDSNTRLLWEWAHHDTRVTYYAAITYCDGLELGGKTDWRLPTISELFSLADFTVNLGSLLQSP